MSRHVCLLATVTLAFAAACGSDKSNTGDPDQPTAEPTAEPAKAAVLPPIAPLGKPAAELEVEGWKASELPPEAAARLRDSAPMDLEIGSPALQREFRGLAASAPSFDSLGSFADTVRLVERALMRMAAERRDLGEAAIVDSLKQAMEPRDPDLDAVPNAQSFLPTRRAPRNQEPGLFFAAYRQPPHVTAFTEQGSQTKTFQLAPGLEGTETTSSDGSSATVEMTRKGSNEHGSAEATVKGTTSLPGEFEKQGEVGWKTDLDTKMEGKFDGASAGSAKGGGMEARLKYCPDAAGLAKGRYKRWFRESLTANQNGVAYSEIITINAEFALTVQVNDEARATDLLVEGYTDVSMEIRSRGGGNSTPIIIKGRGEARAQGVTPSDPSSLGSMHFRLPAGQSARALKFTDSGLTEELVNAITAGRSLTNQAEQRWRNGACVEVTTSPESKALRFSGKTTLRTEVRHKRDPNGAFSYPVRVMIQKTEWFDSEGKQSGGRTLGTVTPQVAVTAPATFSYTAPAKGTENGRLWRGSCCPPKDEVFPMSVSRRGIGLTRFTVPYDSLRRTFWISHHHRIRSEKQGEHLDIGYRAVVRELDQPDEAGHNFVGTGEYDVRAVDRKGNCLNDFPDDEERYNGRGSLRATASVSDDGPHTTVIFTLEPLSGPRRRTFLFTRSFRFMEQQARRMAGIQNEELPLVAALAGGLLRLEGDSAVQSRQEEIANNVCTGSMVESSRSKVVRIR